MVIERFKDEATFETHIALEYSKDIGRSMAEQTLLSKPLNVVKVVRLAGLDSRRGKAKL